MSSTSNQPASSRSLHDKQAQKEAQEELSQLLRCLQHDPTLNGILNLGKDGVLRSLTADREVVDAIGLRPELIKAFLDRMPFKAQNEIDFRGADGTKVSREQWFHPVDKSTFPPPYTPPEERRHLSPEQLDKNRRWLEERAVKARSCEPTIVSDHDLGLKGMTSNLGAEEKTKTI
jgi:hypothetical protein